MLAASGDTARAPVHVTGFDYGQPGLAQTTATYHLATLLAYGRAPE